jgi:hypothetical protein
MDIHKNARLSFRSRELLARFVIEQWAIHNVKAIQLRQCIDTLQRKASLRPADQG